MEKPMAIVFKSNTGYTKKYAELLAEQTGLPVYSLEQSDTLAEQTPIIYLGWLMAGVVQGYKKAVKRFRVCAVCGVGMGATGSQIEDVRKNNNIGAEVPVYTLQGGFNLNRLHGVYKFMMQVMKKTAGRALAEKQDRTPEEDVMLKLLMEGGDCVSSDNLAEVVTWYKQQA